MERLSSTKRRNLAGGKFEVNNLVLRAQNVHLPDIRDGQYLCADIFDLVAQLAQA